MPVQSRISRLNCERLSPSPEPDRTLYSNEHEFRGSSSGPLGRFGGLYRGSTRHFWFTVECSVDPSGIGRLAPRGIRQPRRFKTGS